jgi:hypothetical protein
VHGRVQLHHDGANHDLRPGTATHIGVGEPVSSPNPGPDHAELVVVAASPDFA